MSKKLLGGLVLLIGVIVSFFNEIYNFLITAMPTRLEFIVGNIGAVFGIVAFHLFGSYDDAIESLLVLMTIDVITGVTASVRSKIFLLNSKKGFRGMTKKFGVILMVVTAYKFGQVLPHIDAEVLKDYVICAFCTVEVLSITENLGKCGVPIPAQVKNMLEQLAQQKAHREVQQLEASNTRTASPDDKSSKGDDMGRS